MAAKLKSISRQIHWSLLGRAALFALAWFFLPFWLFALIALYLYFFPLFNTWKLFWLFFALLVLAYIEESGAGSSGLVFVVIFAALFYYLLLIKDLLLIDRKSAYELLILVLVFFLFRDFYGKIGIGVGVGAASLTSIITGVSLWYGLLVAALIGLLVNSFIRTFSDTINVNTIHSDNIYSDSVHENPMRRITVWLAFILVWQFLILGLFLPLDFAYQSVVVFLASVFIVDLLPEACIEAAGVSRQRIVTTGITAGVLLFIVLASAHWGL